MSDENKIEQFLTDGEQIILIDSAGVDFSLRGKLVLTSKRLFLCGAKSTFNRNYVIKKEFDLIEIDSVQGDLGKTSILGVTDPSWLVIKPKVGDELRLQIEVSAMLSAIDFNNSMTMQMTKVTNWVNQIKLELLKLGASSKSCANCGKQLSQGNFEFCPFCGNSLKP